ncbi:hypothetical protein H310_08907 [Aphanomyces invadans]|uniref:Poly [ADP-ribose] polymerase n=1 Tax=Aphanomyces invadans TaxID=157072 RepID=A0A024TVX1_9STRA|nr:hypothetical protein H310_08907 [Aphanomyces invadans]ETV98178.1 hypothetical protein H310_08907 [Aphanomyces invadans]|eukprot:XP_008873053.1 hypothetical protein H310_08907 [Aphanomyces invadans]
MGNCSATFGRGIYLATMFEKAKQHSTPARVGGRSVGFAFLVEAAIGDALVVPKYGLVGTLPAGFNTVLVKGRRFPNPTEDEVVCKDGQDVRVGIGPPTTDPANPLYHDEVVVYDERLVQLRYVVAFDM